MPRAIPAAVISVVVEAQGVAKTAAELAAMDKASRDSAKSASQATKGANDLDKQTKQLSFSMGDLTGKTKQMSFAFEDLGKSEKQTARQTAEVNREHRGLAGTLGSVGHGLTRTTAQMYQNHSMAVKLKGGVSGVNQEFTLMRHVIGLIKIPALITGLVAATQAVNALAGGLVALVSALGPVTGALVAYPALLAALAQGFLTSKLAMSGLGDGFKAMTEGGKKWEEALKKLSPAQKEFLLGLRPVVKEAVSLKAVAQTNMLPGLSDGIKAAAKNLPVLRTVIGSTATAMGDMARQFGTLLGSKSFGADFAKIGAANVGVLRNLGAAAMSFARALTTVLVVARPLIGWMTNAIKGFAHMTSVQAEAAQQSGKMAGFFDKTRSVLQQLASILKNTAGALLNIGKAASPLGGEILGDLERLTKRFKEWTGSASGQNTLAQYFRDIKAPLYAVFELVGGLGKAFFDLSKGDLITPLVKKINSDLLPVLVTMGQQTAQAFGPVLIDALTNFGRLFGALVGTAGPLNIFVKILGTFAGVLADMLQGNPALQQAVVSWVSLAAVWKSLAILSTITQMGKLTAVVAFLTTTTKLATAATIAERDAIITNAAATKAGAAATAAFAAAQRIAAVGAAILGASMLGIPIVAIIVGIAALVAALILAYKHSESFRNIVDSVAAALRAAGQAVLGVAPVVSGALVSAFTASKTAVQDFATVFGSVMSTMLPIVKAAWEPVKAYYVATWGVIKAVFSGAFIALKAIIQGGIQILHGIVMVLGGVLKGDFGQIWKGIKEIFSGAFTVIKGMFDAAVKTLGGAAAAIGTGIKSAFDSTLGKALGSVESFIQSIINVVNDVLGFFHLPKIPDVKKAGAGANQKAIPGQKHGGAAMARGGAYGMTGGYVNAPMVMMGEEAPRYPEYVIPTNPAYRGRARGLLGAAAGAIGFAQGGVLSKSQLAALWASVNPGLGDPNLMAAIAMAESGGRNVVNSIGAGGYWQIYPPEAGYLDPVTNAAIAGRKLRTQGLSAWVAYTNGSYKKFMGGGGGILGAIGGFLGGIPKALQNVVTGGVEALIGKLPDPGSLPGWLQGMGKYIVDHAADFLKDKFNDLLGMVGGGGGGARGPKGVGSFNGVPMANWVIESLRYAQSKGVAVAPTSGYRPGFDPHTVSGKSEHQGIQYPHGAVDFGGYNTGGDMKRAVVAATAGFKYPLLNPIGFHDEGHASGTGHRRGGVVMPYVGAFRDGGFVNQTGLGLLHKGETVVPGMAQGGVINMLTGGAIQLVNGQWSYVDNSGGLHKLRVGFGSTGQQYMTNSGKWAPLAANTPVIAGPTKGAGPLLGQVNKGSNFYPEAPGAADGGAPAEPEDTTPYSQADIDKLNDSITALNATIEQQNRLIEQQNALAAAMKRDLATSQSQYAVLARAIADITSGQLGGRVGLGFMSPSFAGGGVRY